MDRRSFLFGFCKAGAAVAGVATLAPLLLQQAEATPLEALKNLPALEPDMEAPDVEAPGAYGEAPDGTPADSTYWVWRNGRRYWVAPRRRRRRRVCRRVRVRGGWARRCWWQYF